MRAYLWRLIGCVLIVSCACAFIRVNAQVLASPPSPPRFDFWVSDGPENDGRAPSDSAALFPAEAEDGENGGFDSASDSTVYRALLIGEQQYVDGRTRLGSVNTTQGITDMLLKCDFNGARYLTTIKMDVSKREALEAIATTFRYTMDNDISLFYINCHGGVTGGVAWLQFHDGSRISAVELEHALRAIRGMVIVVIDCCNSGAFIGLSGEPDTFNTGVIRAFSHATPYIHFASSQYKVLVSSSFDQNSYRISNESPAVESSMATVFSRALSEGCGWDLLKDKVCSMKADLDRNREITLNEAYVYLTRRVMFYLQNADARQHVQLWPEGDQTVFVKR